jgi:putative transposase
LRKDSLLPRLPRNILPGIPLHIIRRGNNRDCGFFAQRDYIVYLDKLDEYSKKFNVAAHGFVMSSACANATPTYFGS